jgi:hypothetical protein
MTYKEFCNRYNITAESEWADGNPNMDDWRDANHFKVTLMRRDPTNGVRRQMTVPFSQGYGIQGNPTADSVLECMAMDAGYEDYTFEEWCREFGYDDDSRKAERTFKTVQAQSKKLEQFLGSERLEELRECEE